MNEWNGMVVIKDKKHLTITKEKYKLSSGRSFVRSVIDCELKIQIQLSNDGVGGHITPLEHSKRLHQHHHHYRHVQIPIYFEIIPNNVTMSKLIVQ